VSYNAKRLQLLEKCKNKIREQAHLSMRWLRKVGKRAVFPSILLRPKVSECVQHKFLGSVCAIQISGVSVGGVNHVDTISRALVLRQVKHPGSLLEDHRCASAVRIGEIICVIFHQESQQSNPNIAKPSTSCFLEIQCQDGKLQTILQWFASSSCLFCPATFDDIHG